MVLYILSFIDRSNIGNAKIAGMNKDLGLTGSQYNIALTVFFFPYGLFEIPSNIVLKLMRPSWWIGILVVAWGTVCLHAAISHKGPRDDADGSLILRRSLLSKGLSRHTSILLSPACFWASPRLASSRRQRTS